MHGPVLAKEIRRCRGRFPGVCQSSGSIETGYSFFVRYRRVGQISGPLEQWEAVINMLVADPSTSSMFFIPFVIDTGTDVTIIPRNLVPKAAFPTDKAVRPYTLTIIGFPDWIVFGRPFSANLAIVPPAAKYEGLGFKGITITVVDSWEGKYALLGLDALRQVVMVSDSDHVSFWPLPTGT